MDSKQVRSRCFFDLQIGDQQVGRIIFELYTEVCPKTCANFRALCTGELGNSPISSKPLHFKGAPFHRIIRNFMIQGGDFTMGDGTGGESIYGKCFPDESFEKKHDKEFLLSMANHGKNTNGSQFFITTRTCPHLDGIHVVFGEVVHGNDIVRLIESVPVDPNGKPNEAVSIANCGELVRQKKPNAKKRKVSSSSSSSSSDSSSSSSSSSSEEEDETKRKKKKKKSKTENGEEEAKKDSTFCTVRSEEIPDVPSNRFLMRNVPDEVAQTGPNSKRFVSKSGRKIKGRGALRYRTPSRSNSRERSATPPHWRREQNKLRPLDAKTDRADNDSRKASDGRKNDRGLPGRPSEKGREEADKGRRSRDRREKSWEGRNRSRDVGRSRGYDYGSRDYDGRSRDRRDRSRDDRDRSRDGRDRSRDGRDRSRDGRDRTRDGRDRTRDDRDRSRDGRVRSRDDRDTSRKGTDKSRHGNHGDNRDKSPGREREKRDESIDDRRRKSKRQSSSSRHITSYYNVV